MKHMERPPGIAPASLQKLSSIFWTEDSLRFSDLDANAHVSNRTFCEILENGRMALIRGVVGPMLQAGTRVVIARLTVDFHRQLRFPGHVYCATWISQFGSSSFNLGQILLDSEGIASSGSGICVISDLESGRAAPIPEDLREFFEEVATPELSSLYTRSDGRDYAHQRMPVEPPSSNFDGGTHSR